MALLWTGATDFGQSGYWTWSESKAPVESYQHWAPHPWRPGTLGPVGRGHCMALRGDGRWASFRCPNRFPYLCERDSAPSSPSSTTSPPTPPPSPPPTPAGGGGASCQSITLQGPAWVKLPSSLLSHPPGGLCYVNIVFSTFSNGLLLRKFDWNDESITLSIIDGQLVVRMATGSGQDISVSSPYIVTDGLEHSATLSIGVGRLSLAVDDDISRVVESSEQPGLGQDANVFVGGQPGGDYSGYSGCIDSLRVLVTADLEPPDWSRAVLVDFTGPRTILYGNHQCGVCRLREGGEEEEPGQTEVWGEVSELPRPLTSLSALTTALSPGPETNRGYSDNDWTVESKPILVLDRQTTQQTSQQSTTASTTTTSSTTSSTTTTTTTTATTTTTRTSTTTTTTTTSSTTTTTTTSSTTTRLSLVRGVCSGSEVSLGGVGWLEMSSKLLPHRRNMKTIVRINFSSRQRNSLLLWQGDHRTQHYFAVALVNGFLEFR